MSARTDTEAAAAQAENSTSITPDSLSAALKERVGAVEVVVEDMSGGCGQMFSAVIVSPQFEGKRVLARNRLVNTALKGEIALIHAWTAKCFTEKEWEERGRKA